MINAERIALGDLFDIGSSKRVFQSEWRTSGIPFYRAREIAKLASNGYVDNELFIDEGLYNQYIEEYGKPMPGDIMVTGVGTLGVCYIVQEHDKFYFKDGNILWFRAKCSDRVLSEFVVRAFDSDYIKDEIKKNSSGTTVGTFTIQTAKQLEILVPSLSVQQKVVGELSCIDNLIMLRKEQLAKLDQLVKSRFVEMFEATIDGSAKVLLDDISDFVTVGIANSATHAYADSGIVMLRNQNIKENYLDESDLIYITPEFAQKYGSKQLVENDILVIRTGYPGVACLVPKKYEGSQTFTTLIIRLKNPSLAHANYVCHYINSRFGKDYVDQSKVGVAQQNFGAKALAKMPIVLPSLELQTQFADFVDQTNKSKLTIQASLDKLELLKKSLMQQYFS